MGVAAAVALLALWAAPAEAGFRYVPPLEAAAEPAEKGAGAAEVEAPPRPGPAVTGTSVSGTSVLDPRVSGASVLDPRVWRVREGEMLRAVLARWAERTGTDVVFLTDRRYRLEGYAAFEGGFADAAQALFLSLSHLPHAPVAARSEGGSTLVVTHRLPASAEGVDKP